jgi:hypothetical protein
MKGTTRFSLAVLALGMVATVSQAQGTADTANTAGVARVEAPAVAPQTAPEVNSVKAGPTLEKAGVGVKSIRAKESGLPAPAPLPAETRSNQALMIVGFGGMIAGAIIGGDAGTIIMIAGAGMGLYGLWKYLE